MASRSMNLSNQWGITSPQTNPCESRLVEHKEVPSVNRKVTDFFGIEIEIEGMGANITHVHVNQRLENLRASKDTIAVSLASLVYAKQDGSLRNNGVEFVTHPIHLSSLERILQFVYNFYLRTYHKSADFTERCGIHGHFDVSRLNIDQIKMFLILYAIYENEFFRLAGPERACSNFCVPIRSQSPWTWFPSNSEHYNDFHAMRPRADHAKYSAFNITRMADLGTVEFRHLPGTWNISTITEFFGLIQQMKEFAIRQQYHSAFYKELDVANTISSYRKITDQIFGANSRVIWRDDSDYKGIEDGISFAKKFDFLVKNNGVASKPASSIEVMENAEFSKKFSQFLKSRQKELPKRSDFPLDDWLDPPEEGPRPANNELNRVLFRLNGELRDMDERVRLAQRDAEFRVQPANQWYRAAAPAPIPGGRRVLNDVYQDQADIQPVNPQRDVDGEQI